MKRAKIVTAESRGASRRQGPGRRVDVLIGKRLREARRLAGATPQQLAAALGVTTLAVQKCETGARRLTAAQMAAAVKFLGVPMSFLIKEDAAATVTMADAGLTALEIELVQCFRAIADDTLRQRVLRLAKAASEATSPEE